MYEISVYGKPADFAVQTSEKNSIRINGNSGIRFGGFVSAKTLLNADECGFIIARGDLLNAKGLASEEEVKIASVTEEKTDGSFTAATENGLKLVGARNYRKDDFNKLTASDDGSTPFGETYDAQGFWFTGVLVSLENSYTNADDGKTYAHRYNVPFAARAYVKSARAIITAPAARQALSRPHSESRKPAAMPIPKIKRTSITSLHRRMPYWMSEERT